jgi:multidrug resistance efflux pump
MRHSDVINDIIARQPIWLLRWGAALFLILLLTLGFLSHFIHFQDTVEAESTLFESGIDLPVTTKTNGLILRSYAKNNESVRKGQVLLEIVGLGKEIIPITAPVTGKIGIIGLPMEGQYVEEGTPLYYINSGKTYYGLLSISPQKIQSIRKKQDVVFNLKRYPGIGNTVHGVIDSISDLPAGDHQYKCRVLIKPGDNFKLLNSGLRADATVVIGEKSLLQFIAGKWQKFY